MTAEKRALTCPHCDTRLRPFTMPAEGGWGEAIHYACFNNDCPYYTEGWAWMREQYEAKASYRYRIDPETGVASPLAVWSETAIVNRIIDE